MKKGKGVVIAAVTIVLILIILGISLFSQKGAESPGETIEEIQEPPQDSVDAGDAGTSEPTEHTIEITSSGFNPKTLDIKKGDTVTFISAGASRWPASNVHPSHTVYPVSGGCIGSAFDACKELAQGESYSFTFNEVGTWKYHDHLSPDKGGTIIVS